LVNLSIKADAYLNGADLIVSCRVLCSCIIVCENNDKGACFLTEIVYMLMYAHVFISKHVFIYSGLKETLNLIHVTNLQMLTDFYNIWCTVY